MSEPEKSPDREPKYGLRNKLGLGLAPVILLLFLFTSPPEGLSVAAWRTAGITLPQMAKAGLVLNLITFIVIALMVFTVGNYVFDLNL